MRICTLVSTIVLLFISQHIFAQAKVYTALYDNSNFNRAIDLSKPVGATPGQEGVSSTGAATYTIPIALPPGTNGHVPSLSVSYNSQAANGVLGYGWSIVGLSAITRARKNWFHEPHEVGPTQNQPDDKYALDGSRLMLLSGNYGAAGSIYGTEVENYARIEAMGSNANGPNWFRVTTKEGVIMEYGNSPSSQVINTGHKVMRRLNKVIDRNGNYYEYVYDNTDDDSRISEIRYTGNVGAGLAPYNNIYFDYSVRQDQNTVYEAGLAYNMKYILDRIRVTGEGGQAFKTYEFKHGFDLYSFLTEVIEKGSDGSELNSTIFKYGEQPQANNFPEGTLGVPSNVPGVLGRGDFDGDGFDDVVTFAHLASNKEIRIYKRAASNNPQMGLTVTESNIPNSYDIVNDEYILTSYYDNTIIDFNGDGRDDILLVKSKAVPSLGLELKHLKIYIPNIGATSLANNFVCFTPTGSHNIISPTSGQFLSVGDFNGDGRGDFITYLQKNNSSSSTPSEKLVFVTDIVNQSAAASHSVFNPYANGSPFSGGQVRNYTIDFDGDGKSEIMNVGSSGCDIYGLELDAGGYKLVQIYSTGYPTLSHKIELGDFNGDGKTDIFTRINNTAEIAYSTGNSWDFVPFVEQDPMNSSTPNKFVTADFNGDAKTDICHFRATTPNDPNTSWKMNVYFSKGVGFNYESDIKPRISTLNGDFNGDGRAEIVFKHQVLSTSTILKQILVHPNRQERLLQQIKNGLNVTTTFNHASINKASYTRNEPTTNPYPLNHISAPIYNVIELERSNGTGGNFVTNYFYKDAILHRAGRGFLGYETVITEDLSSNLKTIVEQTINTNFYIPLHDVTSIYRLDTYPVGFLSNTASTFDINSLSNGRFKVEQVYQGSYDGRLNSSTWTTNTFDNNGNITQSVKNVSAGLETTTTTTQYTNAGGTVPYLPSAVTITNDRLASNPVSKSSNLTYDGNGNLISTTDFPGMQKEVTTTFAYNAVGNAISKIVSSLGLMDREETYTYDVKNRFLKSTLTHCNNCPGGGQLNRMFTHPLWGKPTLSVSSDCMATRYEYDAFGRNIELTLPNGEIQQTQRLWDIGSNHRLFKVQKSQTNNPTSITWYDRLGREIENKTQSINAQWLVTQRTYNTKGLLQTATNSFIANVETPITTTYAYDVLNRPLSESNVYGTKSYSYSYNSTNHWLTTTITPSSGNFTTSITDASGKVVQTEDPGGQVTFIYDSWGNQKIIAQNGVTVSNHTFDAYNQKVETTEKNAGTIEYTYNAFGELTEQTDANGNTHEFSYDNMGRLTQRNGPEGATIYVYYHKLMNGPSGSYYCNNNNLSRTVGFDGTIEDFEYDNLNRLTAKHQDIGGTLHTSEYVYDQSGNITHRIFPSGIELEYVYDNLSFLKEVHRAGGPLLYKTHSINGMGQITRYELGNGLQSTNTYSFGFPTQFSTSGVQNLSMNWSLSTGNLTSRENYLTGTLETFSYDILNRLTNSQIMNTTISHTMHYDPFPNTGNSANNMVAKTDAGNYSYTVPQIHTMSSIAHPTSTTLPPPNISANTQTISYTGFQRVDDIEENGWKQEFDYWPEYNRVKSDLKHNGALQETRYYMGDYEIQEIVGGATNKIHYVDGANGLCAIIVESNGNEDIYYVYTDHLGSINKITDAGGNIIAEQSFDAWGRKRSPTDWTYTSIPNSPDWLYRGYTGHEHMPEFKLINMNARLYDPVTGKLISPDNYVSNPYSSQAYNRYAYANNNPLTYVDPDGNHPILIPILIGAAFGGYSGYQIGKANGATGWSMAGYITGGVVIGGISGAAGYGIRTAANLPFANTLGIMGSSLINSGGSHWLSGGSIAFSVSFGIGSYNFRSGKFNGIWNWGSLSTGERLGYSFGALANLQDAISGFNGTTNETRAEHKGGVLHARTKSEGVATGHPDFYDISVTHKDALNTGYAPYKGDPGYSWVKDNYAYGKTYATKLVRGEYYSTSAKGWKLKIYNVNSKLMKRMYNNINPPPGTDPLSLGGLNKLKYGTPFHGCYGQVARALYSVGIPTIPFYGFTPHGLLIQLYMRQGGIYASPYLTN